MKKRSAKRLRGQGETQGKEGTAFAVSYAYFTLHLFFNHHLGHVESDTATLCFGRKVGIKYLRKNTLRNTPGIVFNAQLSPAILFVQADPDPGVLCFLAF